MVRSKIAGRLPLLLALLLTLPVCAADGDTRYVSATMLNVRARPASGAFVQARLKLNEAVTLHNAKGSWCEITASGLEQPGYADCQYLASRPLTLAAIETGAADLILELNRLVARYDARLPRESVDMGLAYEKSPAEFLRIFEQLFDQFAKHFALSPSLRTYDDYQRLLAIFTQTMGQRGSSLTARFEALQKSSVERLPAMRKALTTDFSSGGEPVRRGITATLGEVLEKRQAARNAPKPGAQSGAPVSFFRDGRWAVGWAGGPLVERMKMPLGQGVGYRIRFDASRAAALADVFEMAKVSRSPVGTTFRRSDSLVGGLFQMQPAWDGGFEFVTLVVALPVWGVTDKGLVRGQLRKVAFNGDACLDGPPTHAEVVFPEPLAGTLHAAFISSASIDPALARVTLKRRTWLEPLYSDETTFSQRVQAEIDLDGDGVPDLRTTIKEDRPVSRQAFPPLAGPAGPAWQGWHLLPVAGWYAHDVYQLEVNDSGQWRSLSLYNLVTCT
jgi:hypothetical protein